MYKILHIPTSEYLIKISSFNVVPHEYYCLESQVSYCTNKHSPVKITQNFSNQVTSIPWNYILHNVTFNTSERPFPSMSREEFEIIEVADGPS